MKKNQSKPIFGSWFLLISILFLNFHQTPISAQEVEDEREFDYIRESVKGPRHWGELKKEWKACKHGKLQSPIDLLNHRVKVIPKLGELKMNYRPANATIKNRGHDIAIVWLDDVGSIRINGTNYFLRQCHWHSPSEHSVNGRRCDLELHMVHQSLGVNKKSKIAVLALFYKIGKPDGFLSKISSVSRVRLLKLAVHDYAEMNARPLQPLNERDIHLHGPMFRSGDSKN